MHFHAPIGALVFAPKTLAVFYLSLVLHVAVVVHWVAALHDVVAVVTARTVVPT